MMDREHFEQEPDRVPAGRLAVIGVAGLLVFAVAGLWAAMVERGVTGSVRNDPARPPTLVGAPEVGMVIQPRFDEGTGTADIAAAQQRLESAGWVDRDGGVAHIPIEQAMDLVARRGKL